MLAKDIYQQLESHVTEENKEIIKGYFDLVKQKLAANKADFMNRREVTLEDLNEKFNNKFEEGAHRDSVFVKNGSFNIAFFLNFASEKTPHFLIEEVKNGTTYRTIVTDNFTKTSSISKDSNTGFKEQISFSNINRENSNAENLHKILNLNIGDLVIDLLYEKNKSYTNKEICDLVSLSIPESEASPEVVEIFVEHQSKLRDVINNKVENKLQQKPTM